MAMMTAIEKILAKAAELEAQAAALRLAVTLLNGDLKTAKQATAVRLIDQAMVVRQAQKHGTPAPPAAHGRETHTEMLGRREEKRAQILAILRDYGKPMPIAAFKYAAKERGLTLSGIVGTVRAGHVKKTGSAEKAVYSLPATADKA